MVNIVAFHVALEPSSLGLPLALLGLQLYLARAYRGNFAGVLLARAVPERQSGPDWSAKVKSPQAPLMMLGSGKDCGQAL